MAKQLYRITFLNQGKLYELYADQVSNGQLAGFIEIAGITFGTNNSLVVDPSEERLKTEFGDVSSTHIPFHSVVRVDTVTKQGISKIHDANGVTNVTPFPTSFSPGKQES